MVSKMVDIAIAEDTFSRLLEFRKGFEPADVVVNEIMDLAKQALQAKANPLGMLGVTLIERPAPKPKPASTQELHDAITTVLMAHENHEATNKQVFVEAAALLQTASQHPNWKDHVAWAASDMRKKGLLQNGHDHGKWGVWKLVEPPATKDPAA